jgi:hypothetical protein
MTTTTAKLYQLVSLYGNNRRAACRLLRIRPELPRLAWRLNRLLKQIVKEGGDTSLAEGGLFSLLDRLIAMDRIGTAKKLQPLKPPTGLEQVPTGRAWNTAFSLN